MTNDALAPLTAVAQFFRTWDSYQQILQHNYMEHDDIAQILRSYLQAHYSEALTCLDLGCGDGSFTANVLPPTISQYTGVDLSQPALDLAQTNLNFLDCPRQWLAMDLLTFLATVTQPVDLVLSAFCLHHLNSNEKHTALQEIWRCLKPGGCFLWVDVVRQPTETREDYLDRYVQLIDRDWTAIAKENRNAIMAHIRSSDYPETSSFVEKWGKAAGFSQIKRLYHGAQDTQEAWALQ